VDEKNGVLGKFTADPTSRPQPSPSHTLRAYYSSVRAQIRKEDEGDFTGVISQNAGSDNLT
jgi:hypothetical protein